MRLNNMIISLCYHIIYKTQMYAYGHIYQSYSINWSKIYVYDFKHGQRLSCHNHLTTTLLKLESKMDVVYNYLVDSVIENYERQ